MELNTCDVNHLDADALLPPRKRLLAGLKKQIVDVHSSTSCGTESKYDIRLNNLLRSHLSNPNISNEEIAEASKHAAVKAAKVAEAARANAEHKAAKAAKAVAAAKTALELVVTIEEEAGKKDKSPKKNKMKKHVPVEALYDTNKGKNTTNCRKDEELARNLHRVINSSPRNLRSSPGSESKDHKHKKLKISGRSGVYNVTSNGNGVRQGDVITVDTNSSKHETADKMILDNGNGNKTGGANSKVNEAGKDKFSEALDSYGKKRGRIRQKKLPLSICSFRDQSSSPKDEAKSTMWKCQEFRAPPCVSQNKVMQS